jgi:alanyl aminopeptidase
MFRSSTVALLVAVLLFGQPDPPKLLLPSTVAPLSYEARLRLTPGVDMFDGKVTIDIEVRQPTAIVWLHAKDLVLKKAHVGELEANVAAGPNDFVSLSLGETLQPGRTRITIDYTGNISRVLTDGMFQQLYNGNWYIFTKFEPVTARRGFPCFDEPSFKTPWQLTLRVPRELNTFSNTPVEGETDESDGTKTVRFARTKPLPTYLVALSVGPFDVVGAGSVGRNKAPAHIIVPRGRSGEAAYGAEVTPKAVQLLEDYFGIPYPYEILDQVVVPVTTAWGAMENAGLIAYGQFLLAKPGEDTLPRQRGRLSTMVHEMAHQWFGNLVTMKWWDDIWLNEAFASWLASQIIDKWHPEWKVITSVVAAADGAKTSDTLVSSRKVRQRIETPGDIGLAFDGITYTKGSALLGMFENWLGNGTFRKGIQAHLTRHAWKSATTDDLAAALSAAAGRDVSAAFGSFLDQRGIPLVTADVRCNGNKPLLEVKQAPFVPLGSTDNEKRLWRLPICVRTNDGRECVELSAERQQFPLKAGAGCPEWFHANENGAGYYRVLYEGQWADRLTQGGVRLSGSETVTLLQDAQALVNAGKMDAGKALSLAKHFSDSPEPSIVIAATRVAGSLSQLIPDDLLPNYARFVRLWLGPRAYELGWEPRDGDSDDTKRIRLALVPFVAIDGRDEQLARTARQIAEEWLTNRNSVDRDVAPQALLVAARYGDRKLFDRLVKELRGSKEQLDRFIIIGAFSAFPDTAIVNAALDLVLNSGEGLDPRELRFVISPRWPETRAAVWDYVKQHFDELNRKLPGARGIPYGATLPATAAGFCEESRATEVAVFFRPRVSAMSGGPRNLNSAVESIRLCSVRRVALEAGLRRFLNAE